MPLCDTKNVFGTYLFHCPRLCIAGDLSPKPVSADVGSCWNEPGGCGVAGWQVVGGLGLGGQGLATVGRGDFNKIS